jgi:predicted DNA-binding protein (MmcQ/YjbR family)
MNLEELRTFCNNLPDTTEDVKWEADLCFSIGGKMYCVTGFEEPVSISIKVTGEKFEELTQRKGIRPAPYLARYNWVLIEDAGAITDSELKQLIRESYDLIRSKLPKSRRIN